MKQLNCLRCDSPMAFLMREKFQKGASGAWVGNLNFSFRGGFEMDVYSCPKCGKLEFFRPESEVTEFEEMEAEDLPPAADYPIVGHDMDGVPQVRCPSCGRDHDFDYPRCPLCDYDYK